MKISVVVPTLDEQEKIEHTLGPLQECRGDDLEIVVVDGGSRDATIETARPLADQVVSGPRGRAYQMNHGAAVSRGDVLVFLHADTRLDCRGLAALRRELPASGRDWGRFDVELSGRGLIWRLIGFTIRWRSRLTHVATGDQAIFVRRELFERLGGYPSMPLMEDVVLTTALKRNGPPLCLAERVTTSSRRWKTHGICRTACLMWSLRLAFWLGADAGRLARIYYGPEAVEEATASAPVTPPPHKEKIRG